MAESESAHQDLDIKEDFFDIRIDGKGVYIEQKVPKHVLVRIINILLGDEEIDAPFPESHPVVPSSTHTTEDDIAADRPQLSLREYLDEVNARRNPQKILAIGSYLMKYLGQQGFRRQEVLALFKDAGEPAPANYARDFRSTLANGWIAVDPSDKKHYYVTKRGELALEDNFAKYKARPTKKSLRPHKRKSAVAEEPVTVDEPQEALPPKQNESLK